MRLGGPIDRSEYDSPDSWLEALTSRGYRAAFCPVPLDAPDAEVTAYREAAAAADIVIAEVGAWSSPVSADDATRFAALEKCKSALSLADRIGAGCAVNVTGSYGDPWDGPCGEDLTDAAIDRIVTSIRDIVDTVQPKTALWTIEMMPWMLPDSPDSYLELLEAVDRPDGVAVHFDPVNIINSPRRYFRNGDVIRECVDKLGPQMVSCHAKDILLSTRPAVHLDEVRPGAGELDYSALLTGLDKLNPDLPLMLEHLPNQVEYAAAAAHIRSVADEIGVLL